MHTTQGWLCYNTKHRNNTKGIAYLALMGKLWKDVYWLYTADILPCYNGIELYTPLYVTFICAYPVKVTIGTYESPLESPWGSRNIQGITDRSARGCACVPVCVGMREYPFFCGISIMITEGLLLIWPPGHLQLHCSPSNDGCNHIRWNEWFLLSKAGASIW